MDRTIPICGLDDFKLFIEKEDIYKSEHTVDNKLHTHTEYEILVNLSGDEHVIVEKSIYPFTRGDVILVHPYEHHHCVMKSETKHRLYWLLIEVKPNSPIAKYMSELKSNYYSPESEDRDELIRICNELLHSNCSGLDALRLLLEILNLLKNAKSTSPKEKNTLPKELNSVLCYIDAHLTEELKIKEIAKALGLSESTLTRRFKEFLGVTPLEYLTKKRMIKAAELLRAGNSVLNVGLAVGYSDNSYFIKLFKKSLGISPQEYYAKIIIDKSTYLLINTDYSISEIATLCGIEDALYFSRMFKKHTGISPRAYRKSESNILK